MVGLGQIALNSAPVFGGAMLAIAAGQFKGPDYRGLIKQDMDLLDRLPPDAAKRRADLQRTIDARIDDLVDTTDRSRALRKAALSYQGNWRDVVLLLCVLLFTIIWWDVNHSMQALQVIQHRPGELVPPLGPGLPGISAASPPAASAARAL